MNAAITVESVGKAYKQYDNRWSRLAEWVLPCGRARHQTKWVIKDVSFAVDPGQAVGIIGINGAGKSTLLKLITGTTQPTIGSISIHGRVAAMLELGMGFHPDFTGRQNAYMAGQLLGLRVDEVRSLMPEIESFAEIGDYIDQPTRVLSSGMQMRLAFSVATAVRPDILVVDEALSVGDAYFQHKSFDRIRNFNEQGTTLLIVSHDKQAIQSVCSRAILLDAGTVRMDGEPESVLDYYNALLADRQGQQVQQVEVADGRIQTLSGSAEARVIDIGVFDLDGRQLSVLNVGQRIKLRAVVEVYEPLDHLVFGYGIRDRLGQVAYGTNTAHMGKILDDVEPDTKWIFESEFDVNLGQGSYSVSTALTSSDTHLADNYEWRDLASIFEVVNADKPAFVGSAWLPPTITVDSYSS